MTSGPNPADILGAEIRRRRTRAELTQEELGRKCGVGQTGVMMWELGHRLKTFERLVAVARALGVQPSTLVRCLDDKRTTRMDKLRKGK